MDKEVFSLLEMDTCSKFFLLIIYGCVTNHPETERLKKQWMVSCFTALGIQDWLDGWFSPRASCEAALKVLSRAVVISGLDKGWGIHFQGGTHMRLFPGGPFSIGLLSVLMTMAANFPAVSNLRKQCLLWLSLRHHVLSVPQDLISYTGKLYLFHVEEDQLRVWIPGGWIIGSHLGGWLPHFLMYFFNTVASDCSKHRLKLDLQFKLHLPTSWRHWAMSIVGYPQWGRRVLLAPNK